MPSSHVSLQSYTMLILQMSFETTTTFVVRASMLGQEETLESPSARIVLGEVAKVGTGGFDLLVPIEQTHD